MTNHLSLELLSDLADGALDSAATARAQAHLDECETCATQRARLSRLEAMASLLPTSIAPPDDLWQEIRQELEPRRSGHRHLFGRWELRHLVAAALVIAASSSAVTALVLREHQGVAGRPAPVALAPEPAARNVELPARLASTEHGYERSVESLQRTLDERRDSLAPSTVATVERSLRVADSAIAEARDALARDPANKALALLFASNYERKIDLLRRAMELAPRT